MIGREEAAAALLSRLSQQRLVTVVGPLPQHPFSPRVRAQDPAGTPSSSQVDKAPPVAEKRQGLSDAKGPTRGHLA